MSLVRDHIITWDETSSSLGISQSMATTLFTAMECAISAYSTNFRPIVLQLDSVFTIKKAHMTELIKSSRHLSTAFRINVYPPARYVTEGIQILEKDMRFLQNKDILQLKNGKQTLLLYYELVVIPWTGLIVDKKLQQLLTMFPKLPVSQSFNDAIKSIENELQPLGYTNNKLGFGRKFRALTLALKKILFITPDADLLHDTM